VEVKHKLTEIFKRQITSTVITRNPNLQQKDNVEKLLLEPFRQKIMKLLRLSKSKKNKKLSKKIYQTKILLSVVPSIIDKDIKENKGNLQLKLRIQTQENKLELKIHKIEYQ